MKYVTKSCITVLTVLAVVACNPSPVPENDVVMTRQQGDEIIVELRRISSLLENLEQQPQERKQPRRPTRATLDIGATGPVLGDVSAPVTVVEFTDYQCPYCRRFVQGTFPEIKRDFIDTGKVRWLVRDLPLTFHVNARKAAQAAYCADDQGKFWAMRDSLFRNNGNLDEEHLKNYAGELGLDVQAFSDCLAGERHVKRIEQNAGLAAELRLTGTPSFVIGQPVGNTLDGRVIVGAQAPTVFRAEFDKLLIRAEAAAGQ